jgi:hypothetical protein
MRQLFIQRLAMKMSVLALASAAVLLSSFAAAEAQTLVLSTSAAHPTILTAGEIGTAASDGDTSGASVLSSSGSADYYFELQAPATGLTSYLGDLDICSDVSSSILKVSRTALTAVPYGVPVTTTFTLIPGTEYELKVTGKPKTSFVANISTAISCAPEPAAWALVMFGIGAIGLPMRRRRSSREGLIGAAGSPA